MVDCPTRKFFKIDFPKNVTEKRLFWVLYNPLQKVKSVSLFVKTEKFLFFVDRNLQKCRMTILKLLKDSPRSGEYPRCLQNISGVSRKKFQMYFQKSYFPQKAFFYTRLAHFCFKKKSFLGEI